MLSYVAGQRGDRVGALAFADEVIAHLAPRQGKAQFYRMLSMLYGVQARPIESDYARAFSFVAARSAGPRGGLHRSGQRIGRE